MSAPTHPHILKMHTWVNFIKTRNPGMTHKNVMIQSKKIKNANGSLWRQFEDSYIPPNRPPIIQSVEQKYNIVKTKIIELYEIITNHENNSNENNFKGGRKTRKRKHK